MLTPTQLTFQTAFSVSFPLLWNLEGFGVPVYTGKHVIIIHLEKPSATEAPLWPSAQQQMICSFTQLLVGVDSTHTPLLLQGIDLALSFITYTTRGDLCCRTMCKV